MAKSFIIALAATIALGLSTATFAPMALAADSTTKSTTADTSMKKSAKTSKKCSKLDKTSQAYKDCTAKQAAAKKDKTSKM
jgi:hypothetical protein